MNPQKRVGFAPPLLPAFFIFLTLYAAAAARTTINFNPGWKVFVGDSTGLEAPDWDDSGWKDVTLPHAWNEDDAFKLDIHHLSTGIAWYRKHFNIPSCHAGHKIFIEFEGVRQAGEVWINGEFVGLHENGVMAFGYDITDKIRFAPAENVIAVRTDNAWDYREKATGTSYQWNNQNFNANYGGIPKNVRLHMTDRLYQTLPLYSALGTTGPYIYARNIDVEGRSADITAETQVKNEYASSRKFQYSVKIEDMDGRLVQRIQGGGTEIAPGEIKTVRAGAHLDGLRFWSRGYGYLYTVITILEADGTVVDEVRTRTGFRKTEFAGGMIRLNDRVILVKGYAQRTSNE
ncbi:beta galactosidase jelly roll domain-containing protein, partial [bacterium]|nr:beta galactosidase jelly roll domain-containing protein [bacterium]